MKRGQGSGWVSSHRLFFSAFTRFLLFHLLFAATVWAAPRPTAPPWPEQTLTIYGWDTGEFRAPMAPAATREDTAVLVESWSFPARLELERTGTFLCAVVILHSRRDCSSGINWFSLRSTGMKQVVPMRALFLMQ